MFVIEAAVVVVVLIAGYWIAVAARSEWKVFQQRAVAARRARLRQRPF